MIFDLSVADEPDNHPRLLWRNLFNVFFPVAGIDASGYSDFSADSATVTLPATITVTANSPTSASAIGFVRHDLVSNTVTVEYSEDGSAWLTAGAFQPIPGRAFLGLFQWQTARYWRIRIEGTGTKRLSCLHLGMALGMQRPIYQGHTPAPLNRTSVVRPRNQTSGQFINKQVFSERAKSEFDFNNLGSQWVRLYFADVIDARRQRPLFVSWRPAKYPADTIYGWINQDIAPVNSGPRDLMSVSFGVEGIVT